MSSKTKSGTGTLSLWCCSAKLHCMQVELNDIPVTVLKKGSYFGEIALLRNVRRTASVRALSETCDLFVLTKVSAAGHFMRPALTQATEAD